MSEVPSVEDVQKLLSRGPFHQWLGLNVTAVGDGTIELTATWREEWVVNPDRGYTHGGILATLVDLTADWAMVSRTGRGVPTVDLRVDYHRAAMPGVLTIRGEIVQFRQAVLGCGSQGLRQGRAPAGERARNLSDIAAGLTETPRCPGFLRLQIWER